MRLALLKIDDDPQFPINLARVRASLFDTPHEAVILDGTFIPPARKHAMLLERLADAKPDIVGLAVTDHDSHLTLDFVRQLKGRMPDVHVLLGGPMPTLIPQEMITHPSVDSLCLGDAELLPRFLTHLESGQGPPPRGFVTKECGGDIRGDMRAYIHNDLDALPFMDLTGWDIRTYRRFYTLPNALPLIVSRGCPHSCRFCISSPMRKAMGATPRQYYRLRSPERVIQEIEYHLKRLPGMFESLYFEDTLFGAQKGWFQRFTQLYREQGYHDEFPWSCMTRADTITCDWARKAREAGCVHVRIGVENGDEQYRTIVYGKNIPNGIFRQASRNLHDVGILFNANLIVGGPGETLVDTFRSLAGIVRLDPLYLTFSVFRNTPGTAIHADHREDFMYMNDLPRLSRGGLSPAVGNLLTGTIFPAIQRGRCLLKMLRKPRILLGWANYLLNLDGSRIEPLIGGRKQMHTNVLQQIPLRHLIQEWCDEAGGDRAVGR